LGSALVHRAGQRIERAAEAIRIADSTCALRLVSLGIRGIETNWFDGRIDQSEAGDKCLLLHFFGIVFLVVEDVGIIFLPESDQRLYRAPTDLILQIYAIDEIPGNCLGTGYVEIT